MVVLFLLLGCFGYALARYQNYLRKMEHRVATTLEILKPSYPS